MGKIIQFPVSLANQEQENNEEDQYKGYKEYYSEENQHNRDVFEAEQYIADEELAIESFEREQDKLKVMIMDMKKELVAKRQELDELKKVI